MKFFETSSRNLLAAEAAAGVRHHVALSIVGTDRLPDSGTLRAKMARNASSRPLEFPTRFCAPRSSSSSWAASPILSATERRFASRRPWYSRFFSNDVVTALADLVLGAPGQ